MVSFKISNYLNVSFFFLFLDIFPHSYGHKNGPTLKNLKKFLNSLAYLNEKVTNTK